MSARPGPLKSYQTKHRTTTGRSFNLGQLVVQGIQLTWKISITLLSYCYETSEWRNMWTTMDGFCEFICSWEPALSCKDRKSVLTQNWMWAVASKIFFLVCVSTYFNCWLVNKQFDASVSCPDALSFSKRSFAVFRLALRVRHAFLNWPMYSMSDSSPSMGGNSSSFFSWSRGAAGLGWSLLPLRLTSLQVRTVCQTAPCPGAPVQTPSNVRHLLRHHP